MVVVSSLTDGALPDAAAHHLRRVLRRGSGDPVVLCDGVGSWAPARLGDGAAAVEAVGDVTFVPAPVRTTTVAVALVKGDRPDAVVRHLTELGVGRIVPMVTERTVVRWSGSKATTAHERLVRVATESCQQCRRTHVPEVTELASFDGVVATLEREGNPFGLAVPGGRTSANSLDALLVGPEGGWTDAELGRVQRHVDIGPHVLRAETAAIAAGVAVVGALGTR